MMTKIKNTWVTTVLVGLFTLSLALTSHSSFATTAKNFNDNGYRVDRYRAPSPDQLDGATTLSAEALVQLLAEQPSLLLLDVRPSEWRQGVFLKSNIKTLPGAVWLANVGHGELKPLWQNHLFEYITTQTETKDTPLVVFCRADCWMSWNAAKRLVEAGYTQVYWFKNGIDGWQDIGRPLVDATPIAPNASPKND